MFMSKAKALVQVYVQECLVLGTLAKVPDVTARGWQRRWEREWGVTLKAPTRRYKIALEVQGLRVARAAADGGRESQKRILS